MLYPTDTTPPGAAPLAGVRTQIRALTEHDVTTMSARDRAARLRDLRVCIDALEAEFTRTLAASDTHGDGEMLDGARSTASWLRASLRLAPGDAAERVRIARAGFTGGAPLSTAAAAVAAGDVTFDQLRAIARGTSELESRPAGRATQLLSDLARDVDAGAVRVAARHLRHLVDPDGAALSFAAKFEARRASFAPLLDGMYRLELMADPEGAAVLDAGLTALMAPDGADDLRTTPQRRYDAVITIFRHALGAGSLPTVGGTTPQVMVACTPETVAGARHAPPGVLPDGTPLPQATLDRIACDAAIARVVFGPAGEVLDYGRTRRLFSPAQRRALWARDRGCRFPGCGAPWTQAHHVVPWQHGGATDLSSAVLVCEVHHHRLHEDRWRIEIIDGARGTNGPVAWVDRDGTRRVTEPTAPRWPLPLRLTTDRQLAGARSP